MRIAKKGAGHHSGAPTHADAAALLTHRRERRIRSCVDFFLSSSAFWFVTVSSFGAGKPFFVPSPSIRFGACKIVDCATKTLCKQWLDESDRGVAEVNAMVSARLFPHEPARWLTAKISTGPHSSE